jgi:hypothetical protein
MTYKHDFAGRVKVWQTAIAESGRLSDELAEWLLRPDAKLVQAL